MDEQLIPDKRDRDCVASVREHRAIMLWLRGYIQEARELRTTPLAEFLALDNLAWEEVTWIRKEQGRA